MQARKPNAFMYLDTLVALSVVIILTAMTTKSLIDHNRLQTKFADTRQAQHLAQRVLTDLQLGQPTAAPDNQTRIGIEPLKGGFQPDHQRWVRVTIDYHGQTASLVGLVSLNPGGMTP